MHKIFRHFSKKAFTLVEILLALVILGVGLVSILSLFAFGTYSARRALNTTRSAFLAQLTIEELKLLSCTNFDSTLLSNGTHNEAVINAISAKPVEYTSYSRNLVVTDNNLNTNSVRLKRLDVTITCDNSSEIFTTYVSR